MKFIIIRTSHSWDLETKPCEEAKINKTPDEGYYYVEFNTLEEVMMFAKKYGSIILKPPFGKNENMFSVEIYDSYRE